MSYDIYLCDPITRETLEIDNHQMRGGTFAMGGTSEAWLNITYNYATHYYRVFPEREPTLRDRDEWLGDRKEKVGGVRFIYGLTGAESLSHLDDAIAKLGDEVSADYWQATEGNAKKALTQLRALALLRPDGVWRGD